MLHEGMYTSFPLQGGYSRRGICNLYRRNTRHALCSLALLQRRIKQEKGAVNYAAEAFSAA